MFILGVDISGDKIIKEKLTRISTNIKDFSPIFRIISDRFHQYERSLFQSEGGISGSKWVPLSKRYASWKVRQDNYPGNSILNLSGDLKVSLTNSSAFGSINKIRPDQLVMGTRIPYGIAHQEGRGSLPVRKPIDISTNERRKWITLVNAFIWKGVKN